MFVVEVSENIIRTLWWQPLSFDYHEAACNASLLDLCRKLMIGDEKDRAFRQNKIGHSRGMTIGWVNQTILLELVLVFRDGL